jgi:hypothetical protein
VRKSHPSVSIVHPQTQTCIRSSNQTQNG